LIFYFAGHGYTKKIYGNDIGYLLPVNCPNPDNDPGGFQTRAMPMGQIELFAQQIQSKHALFMFDACFSGAVFSQSRDIPGIINYKTTQPVRQFITSGSAEETVPDKSIFRQQFIAALNGDADMNNDGFLTGTELGDFLQTTVVNYSRNSLHPQFGKIRDPNLDKGDFVFVMNTSKQPEIQVVNSEVPPAPAKKQIVAEEIEILGSIELSTELSGSLFVDGNLIRSISANNRYTLRDVSVGEHTIKVAGDQPWEENIRVEGNVVTKVNIKKATKPEETGEIYTAVEQEPQFPGGNEARLKFIQANLIYPAAAKNAGIQGTVFVTFIVERDGSLTNILILRGIGGGCDEEAIRLIKSMPKWNPAIQRNDQVRVQFNLPIYFKP